MGLVEMADSIDFTPKLNRTDLLHTERSASAALVEDTFSYMKQNPIKTGVYAAGALAGVWAISRVGAAMVRGERSVEQAAVGELAQLEFRAGKGLLKTHDGAPIPDLERPFVSEAALNLGKLTEKARESYASDLIKLWGLPRTATAEIGENVESFAARMLKERAQLTREFVTPEATAKELEKILGLNSLSAGAELGGRELTIASDATFVKAAEELQFKHVPQLGQFLKGTGKISETQIEAALQIQRGLPKDGPRKLLGEILVENKLAAQADVDLAFANQQELKSALRTVREKFLSTINIEK